MKGSSRRLVLSLAAGLAATASASLATAASAQPIREREVFEETHEFEDFCDVSGLTVRVDSTTETRFMFNPHGPEAWATASNTSGSPTCTPMPPTAMLSRSK
jgi:hypothetical protein